MAPTLIFIVGPPAVGKMTVGLELARRTGMRLLRLTYNEPYLSLPMDHRIEPGATSGEAPALVEYRWRHRAGWCRLAVNATGAASPPADGPAIAVYRPSRL